MTEKKPLPSLLAFLITDQLLDRELVDKTPVPEDIRSYEEIAASVSDSEPQAHVADSFYYGEDS